MFGSCGDGIANCSRIGSFKHHTRLKQCVKGVNNSEFQTPQLSTVPYYLSSIHGPNDAISAQIPNFEIQSLFRKWLLEHIADRVKGSRRGRDISECGLRFHGLICEKILKADLADYAHSVSGLQGVRVSGIRMCIHRRC